MTNVFVIIFEKTKEKTKNVKFMNISSMKEICNVDIVVIKNCEYILNPNIYITCFSASKKSGIFDMSDISKLLK
jgi:hypothetical protein